MFWDELMRRWRRENRGLGPNLLVGAGGHVAVAPAPRRRSRRWVILLIAGLAALIALALSTGEVQAVPRLV